MSKIVFLSSFLSLLMFGSAFFNVATVGATTSQKTSTSTQQGVLCGDIFENSKTLEQNFQQCRYELDQFHHVQSNLETVKSQLINCPTHDCFLQWGEILDHVRGEILSNLTLIERSFDLSKEVRMKWEEEWRKVDKEENKVRRDAYNKGFQRQRSTHESDYLDIIRE